jgi:CRISPR-associated endonuclease/helicase Cas3
MSLVRADFERFFAELHDENPPYAWQRRLLDEVLDGGWPECIDAPTGAGKTSVIDVHVFALALAVATGTPLPPRRLAMIVGRRVLVDDQHRYARALADRLRAPAEGQPEQRSGLLREVSEQLWRLQHGRPGSPDAAPLLVALLRGGEPPSRRWSDHPTAAAVICATPEMWGSRLLFGGYGSSARAWPREAGLLALDTVAVVDEAHLSRQLLHTAARVGTLATAADSKWDGPSPLAVVETTATPAGGGEQYCGVSDEDLITEPSLRARLCRPKPVTLTGCKDRTARNTRHSLIDVIAAEAIRLQRPAHESARTVGCFVNSVATAVALTAALRADPRGLTVVMVCGQVRPVDVSLLESRYTGLLSPAGNPEIDVLVSTQTLEVGADVDLAAMVSELAAGNALVQRAGRVNRRGHRDSGPIVVIVPEGDIRTGSGPYDPDTLRAAHKWLIRRAEDPDGLAPWAVRSDPPPPAPPRRIALQRPELGQVWRWARTSDDLAGDTELDLWLSDDLAQDLTAGLVVRRDLPLDTGEAVELVRVLRPRRHEVFPVPLRTLRATLVTLRDDARRLPGLLEPPALRLRGREVEPLDWNTVESGVRPGDVVVLDSATCLFTAGDQQSPPVLVPNDELRTCPAADVLEAVPNPRPGQVVHRIELADGRYASLAAQLDDLFDNDPPQEEPFDRGAMARPLVRDWLREHHDNEPMAHAASRLLVEGDEREVEVILQPADTKPHRVLVRDIRRRTADEYTRQEWTPSPTRVLLADHQRDVADRVTKLATRLGLPAELVDALRQAALHHDDGKADPRFQIRLGAPAAGPAQAKSHGAAGPELRHRRNNRSGLPPGWRHEQRSVVEAWDSIDATTDRELVARLIGTTHGHGRVSFPHVATELLAPEDPPDKRVVAERLFDEGGWDELIEHTDRRYGVWCCAFLEAVLRAADGQISAEGR